MVDNYHEITAACRQGCIRSHVAEIYQQPLSSKNIQVLCVDTVFSGKHRIEVGKLLDSRIAHTLQEFVLAIFASEALDQYLVCTNRRGGCDEMPYIFGEREVTHVQETADEEELMPGLTAPSLNKAKHRTHEQSRNRKRVAKEKMGHVTG